MRSTSAFEAAFPNSSQPAGNGMTTWLIALGVFLAAVALMAVGVIFSNRRIRGSCGGLANLRDETGRPMCEACTHPAPDCAGVAEGRSREDGLSAADEPTPRD